MRALRDEEFDVLHLHEPMAPGPTMTAMLVKPAPIVATFHAAGNSLAYEIFRPFTSRGAHRIDIRYAVSDEAEELARRSLGGEYERAFNGVDISRFHSVAASNNATPTIFFLARHEERKGLSVLLEAFSGLPATCALWVGGVGPETNALRSQYGSDSRIEWLGEIDDDEKVRCMRQADVFCAPSLRGESFGIVLLEAMAAQTAVVASALTGYTLVMETAAREVAGVLVEPGDAVALRTRLHEVLTSAQTRSALVEIGSERVKDFSMARLADLYVDAYQRLIDNTPQDL